MFFQVLLRVYAVIEITEVRVISIHKRIVNACEFKQALVIAVSQLVRERGKSLTNAISLRLIVKSSLYSDVCMDVFTFNFSIFLFEFTPDVCSQLH